MPRRLLSTQDAARLAGVSRYTIAHWCHSGVLPAIKQDGRWAIAPEDLDATLLTQHAGGVVPRWRENPIRAGQRLRHLREAAGLSQLAIERACGLSHERVSCLELGHACPVVATVQRLARVLDVAPEVFVDDTPLHLSQMTAREAATLLDVPARRLHEWLRAGLLPGTSVSEQWRIPAVAVAELARSGRLRGTSRHLDPRYRGST